jgi:uncharacterized membrane protein YcaP (DUF421 family)
MIAKMFFHGFDPLLRTAIGTVVTYFLLVMMLRLSGPRTLAKRYAFDLVVTVALGSTLANGAISKEVSIAQAVLGFLILIALQFFIAWLIVRFRSLRRIVNPAPALLVYDGKFQTDTMKRHRIHEADVRSAVRAKGHSGLEQVGAVVLEADGSFSVIVDVDNSSLSAMKDIAEFPQRALAH